MALGKGDIGAGGGSIEPIGGGTSGGTGGSGGASLRSGKVFTAAKIANAALNKAIRKPVAKGTNKSDLEAVLGE